MHFFLFCFKFRQIFSGRSTNPVFLPPKEIRILFHGLVKHSVGSIRFSIAGRGEMLSTSNLIIAGGPLKKVLTTSKVIVLGGSELLGLQFRPEEKPDD